MDFHQIYLKAHKDLAKKWSKLPFIATNDVIFDVLETWLSEWHTPDIIVVEKSFSQKNKEEAKLHMTQLAKKRRQEAAVAKAQEARDDMQAVPKHKKSIATASQKAKKKACEGQKSS